MKCNDCNLEMADDKTVSCTLKIVGDHNRDTEYFDVNKRCHDCNIVNEKGNFHHLGCDIERCPKCEGQLISCNCGLLTN